MINLKSNNKDLIEDTVKSKMIAEQTKHSSMVWDDVKKEWVSK